MPAPAEPAQGLSETAITSTLIHAVLVSTGSLRPCRAKRGDPWL